MRIGLNNISVRSTGKYTPTTPYSRPDLNNFYKAVIHGVMVNPNPLFRESDELRFNDWEASYDRENAIAEKQNWNKYLDSEEQQKIAQRESLYANESMQTDKIDNDDHYYITHKVFSDGTSILLSYDKKSSNGFPVINFQWFSKPDSITGWSSETTKIRFNCNNDKRMNISSTYYKRFYSSYYNKGYELVKQNASINLETGAVKSKLDYNDRKELKQQVEGILSLARSANIFLPYHELFKQLECLDDN